MIESGHHYNELSPGEAERLAILLEEMGEAQQAIGKILRHGYLSYNPVIANSASNRHHLCTELAHVSFSIKRLIDWDDISGDDHADQMKLKAKSIAKYLHHGDTA